MPHLLQTLIHGSSALLLLESIDKPSTLEHGILRTFHPNEKLKDVREAERNEIH